MPLTIRLRLASLLVVLGSLLLGATVLGNLALYWNHRSLQTIFIDRIAPLEQFNDMRDSYYDLLRHLRQVRENTVAPQQGATVIQDANNNIKKNWSEYLATYLTPEEQDIAKEFQSQLNQNTDNINNIVGMLKSGAMKDFPVASANLLRAWEPTNAGIGKLAALQVREAKAEFARAEETASRSSILLLVCLGLAAIAVAYGIFTIYTKVARPITGMTETMTRLASGELDVQVLGVDRRDEIGAMARAVHVFREALVAKRAADAAAAAENDAKIRRAAALDAATRAFQAQVSRTTNSLSAAATEMEATAQTMSRSADKSASQSLAVSSAAEQTSANVQTVAAASEELAASIGEINTQVARSSDMAERAANDANETNVIVMGLAEGAHRIGDVVGLISGIAAQTNLLALNATIEAARAGEAGRGFAVVAVEVKTLAEQTAKATETISQQIATIQSETDRAVDAIQAIAATIMELRTIAVGVAASMEEQGAVTHEIVRNVSDAARGTQAVTVTIGAVRQVTEETGASAAHVLTAAAELSRQSEQLSAEVATFLATVQAA
ncbi:methyl-accepting chemotaxis protein [Methylobacterium sp. NEAU K]|uniref:methyl-accepting chemotaxis protein n=1 Tax=Methylobacterium sp. NEAU K TaxID=3064946 RepID=UPI002732C7C5|nr:methyl-accepting chemotaxis protein [Methylobacterium sp. NEAU K]MDP4003060.1 methyl-accepting chemotaxis protein [Methylobacterium sp. NEAU K]